MMQLVSREVISAPLHAADLLSKEKAAGQAFVCRSERNDEPKSIARPEKIGQARLANTPESGAGGTMHIHEHIQDDSSTQPIVTRERRTWVTPRLHKIDADSAENGIIDNVHDNVFTFAS